ncbi:MAG: DUF3575 domain-containing protein [Saprospiraceae bacterium]|nr:DUF3575 domain-containing protein [Saprospiraceae bacterium]
MKKTLLLCAWLAPFWLFAQNPAPDTPAPAWIVKISPLVWLHPYFPSFDVAVERRISPNWYAEVSAGKMFNIGYADNPVLSALDGYRADAGAKYYFRPPASRRYTQSIQAYGSLLYADANIEGDFCRFDCTFSQRINYQRLERKWAFYVAYGGSLFFGRRWIFEFDGGFGYVYRDIHFGDVPPDATFRTNGSLIWNYGSDGIRQQIEPNVRVKLGVVIF